jgi:hypothetical protein
MISPTILEKLRICRFCKNHNVLTDDCNTKIDAKNICISPDKLRFELHPLIQIFTEQRIKDELEQNMAKITTKKQIEAARKYANKQTPTGYRHYAYLDYIAGYSACLRKLRKIKS